MHKPNTIKTVALLPLLLAGCASKPALSPIPSSPPIVSRQVTLPPLPKSARQPQQPPECSPTCLQALTIERERWQQQLMQAAPPDSPASGPMTPGARP